MKKLVPIAAASLFTVAPSLYAVEEELLSLYAEEELVSIATGTDKPIRFAPSVATVLTQHDIRRMGATTVAEALEAVPGLHVATAFLFTDSLISIRGIHTNNNPQVAFLVDGVEVSYLATGARPPFFMMPVENISRIEVIRGPGSAVYGADAFSGVINVVTRGAQEDQAAANVGARVGSFNSSSAWLQMSDSFDSVKAAFSFEYMRSPGDDGRVFSSDSLGRSGPLATDYEVFNTQLKLETDNAYLRLHNWHQNDAGAGAGSAQALDPSGAYDSDLYQLDSGLTLQLGDDWVLEPSVAYHRGRMRGINNILPAGIWPIGLDGNLTSPLNPTAVPGVFPGGVIGIPVGRQEIRHGELVFSNSAYENHALRFSMGYQFEGLKVKEVKNFGPGVLDAINNPARIVPDGLVSVTGTENIFIDDQARENYFISAQDEWKFSHDWELTVGFRYDKFSDFGDTFNPRLALVWAADYNLTLKALYGRAFKAPSFSDLFAKNNPSYIGNPDLEPETIDTFELAMAYQHSADLGLKSNVFYYEIRDLIDAVFDPATGQSVAQNARDLDGTGFELEADWNINSEFTLKGNYAFHHVEAARTNEDVADAPSSQLYVDFNWSVYSGWSVSTIVNWVASRDRADADIREPVDDYVMTNFAVIKTYDRPGVDLRFIVKNAFNEGAYEPSPNSATVLNPMLDDYRLPGRAAFVEFNYHFVE